VGEVEWAVGINMLANVVSVWISQASELVTNWGGEGKFALWEARSVVCERGSAILTACSDIR